MDFKKQQHICKREFILSLVGGALEDTKLSLERNKGMCPSAVSSLSIKRFSILGYDECLYSSLIDFELLWAGTGFCAFPFFQPQCLCNSGQ